MKITLFRDIDSSSPLPSSGELTVIIDNRKKKKYHLSETWLDRFQRLMKVSEHKGTFGEPGSSFQHHYSGHSWFKPVNGQEKEVEALYHRFRKNLVTKRIVKTIFLLGFLTGLALIIL
ncbi:MAG: hypothetical protein Q8N56_00710 [bacterium]|nr:hypothetical protein [bacterium]